MRCFQTYSDLSPHPIEACSERTRGSVQEDLYWKMSPRVWLHGARYNLWEETKDHVSDLCVHDTKLTYTVTVICLLEDSIV